MHQQSGLTPVPDADLSRYGSFFSQTAGVLVRLPIEQMRLDRSAGLKTEAFVTGYQGSPLAGYDLRLEQAKPTLERNGVHFVPGFNEELAATSVMGTQMVSRMAPESSKLDGVVSFWYGKAPGLDRATDAIRHGNFAGTAGAGAVVLLVGDDPPAKSSTLPSDSRSTLQSLGIPVLEPGDTQAVFEYGLAAVALSRYTGAWTALKLVTGVCDSGATVTLAEDRQPLRQPGGEYRKQYGHLLMAPESVALEIEVNRNRLNAAFRFAQLNGLNRIYGADRQATLGIVAAGKTYHDVLQALNDMGLSMDDLTQVGVRLAQLGMTFPLDPTFAREFSAGLSQIVVVEEKRSFVEAQLRDFLYSSSIRPEIIGKFDSTGTEVFPAFGELNPDLITQKLAPLLAGQAPERLALKIIKRLRELSTPPCLPPVLYDRKPSYCPGCPHSRSTVEVPGSMTGGGIGCHTLGMNMTDAGRGFQNLTQMGGEGSQFIGIQPFLAQQHFVQNIGDGTYFHSGSLAIQACIAQGMNVTFRLLNNRAVAMTGGQPVQGAIDPASLSHKFEAEGVKKTVIVTRQHNQVGRIARNAELRRPEQLTNVMQELQRTPGVTVLIYDQECTAELRRMRNLGERPQPKERVVIHEQVCEGCGHCVAVSNCISLRPVATSYGTKMSVHQGSCNQDMACVEGDCPSFVSITLADGGRAAAPELPDLDAEGIPTPMRMALVPEEGYRIELTGIGGDGIVSTTKLLANAAALDGRWVATYDETGLAQKSGSVVSHLYLGHKRLQGSVRANHGAADVLIAYDLVTAQRTDVADSLNPAKTVAVLNTNVVVPAQQVRRGNWERPNLVAPLVDRLGALDANRVIALDGNGMAEALFGDSFAVNCLLLGIAFQAGWVPISLESLRASMSLSNWAAFTWGRKYVHEPDVVARVLEQNSQTESEPHPTTVLRKYQSQKWAEQYAGFLESVDGRIAAVVGSNLLKLMTYKDEYEVARLLSSNDFHTKLSRDWRGIEEVHFNLHPPVLRGLGLRRKIRVGPMALPLLRGLARLSVLRGTPLDIFGWTKVRRAERSSITWYRHLVRRVSAVLTTDNLPLALEILDLPGQIRGYEGIKLASIERVLATAENRLRALSAAKIPPSVLEINPQQAYISSTEHSKVGGGVCRSF